MNTDRDAWTQWAERHSELAPTRTPKANKYHATKVQLDGIWFDSQREADRYQELRILAAAGIISGIEIHPGFPLIAKELYRTDGPEILHTVGMYHADFKYFSGGKWVVEDVKSKPTKTEAYKLRKRFVEAQYGITIVEIV